MQLTPGTYRFIPARSRARVIAHAPGHDFRAEGAGVEGTVELGEDRLLRASAKFPLDALAAGDPLGNHELRKFLGLDSPKTPSHLRFATGEISAPIVLSGGAGEGSLTFAIGPRSMQVRVRLEGTPAQAVAKLQLTFGGLGWSPPKLLFLRVKDTLDVEISAQLEPT